MDEFTNQIKNAQMRDIHEFNNRADLVNIRNFYQENFDRIKLIIQKEGPKIAIESIVLIDATLADKILENSMLIGQINRAIVSGSLNKSNIS